MKLILTGATGMVGEGVLLRCLERSDVLKVLSVSRRPSGIVHDKLDECLVPDFRDLSAVEARLSGYDGCLYCAGISSAGMSEADYRVITLDTPLAFAQTLVRLNPGMVFCHVSGSHTNPTGRAMWQRVKGAAENALAALPFKAVYNFRPGLMKPAPGQRRVGTGLAVVAALYPLLKLFFGGLQMREVGDAMINAVRSGAPKAILEVADMRERARSD